MRKRNASFKIFLITAILAAVPGVISGLESSRLEVSLELKSWLVLELSTPTATASSAGHTSSGVNMMLDAQNTVVNISVLMCVTRGQEVELRVLPLGPLMNQQNGITPISQISWTCSGDGFIDGALNEGNPQSMAHWTGPGQYSGTVQYRFPVALRDGNYSQVVTYSLYTL